MAVGCKLMRCNRHDDFKATIDHLRACADPKNKGLYNHGCKKFCQSMNDTLVTHIQYDSRVQVGIG